MEKRKCDCWLKVGKCHCDHVPVFDAKKQFRKKIDPLEKKIPFNRSIKRKVAIEFESVLNELGFNDLNNGLEVILESFIKDYRDSVMKNNPEPVKNIMGKEINWDIND